MTDITKCNNNECLSKETCYRYTAQSNKYGQSYGAFTGTCKDDCDYYIEDKIKEG